MAVALNLALTIFIITSAKKPSFLSAGSFCFAQNHHEAIDEKDSRTCATLWIYKLEKGFYLGQHPNCRAAFRILLLLAGDIEYNRTRDYHHSSDFTIAHALYILSILIKIVIYIFS